MVTCELIGRLGNQLFQIAATIGYAKKFRMDYHIPDHTADNDKWHPMFKNLTNERFNPLLPTIDLIETTHAYRPFDTIHTSGDTNIRIRGYRQSYKYFEHCIDDVRKAVGVPQRTWIDSCAVHMRFGDYRMYPTKHPIPPKDYFDQAIDEMVSQGITEFVFFSDEPKMCHDYISRCHLPIEATVYDSQNPLECFFQLCSYGNLIITNSSFSLLAAILSDAPPVMKSIISPSYKQWFGPDNAHLDTRDMLPNYFKQITY